MKYNHNIGKVRKFEHLANNLGEFQCITGTMIQIDTKEQSNRKHRNGFSHSIHVFNIF